MKSAGDVVRVVGVDIGGANLKVADARRACSRPFPLWKFPERLADELAELWCDFAPSHLAITMTGELCDAFQTKEEGVRHILEAVTKASPPDTQVHIWQTDGCFRSPTEAIQVPWRTAAGNWLALATWLAPNTPKGTVLLIDTGSTTTDIVLIRDGQPCPLGRSDPERLSSGELLYQGVVRTPLVAILDVVHLNDRTYPLMAEWFATSLDAYLILGRLDEDPVRLDSADGRSWTIPNARDRLARMIGSDRTRFSLDDAQAFARQAHESLVARLLAAMDRVCDTHGVALDRSTIFLSGQGEFLAADALSRRQPLAIQRCSDWRNDAISTAACAFAVAQLLEAQLLDAR